MPRSTSNSKRTAVPAAKEQLNHLEINKEFVEAESKKQKVNEKARARMNYGRKFKQQIVRTDRYKQEKEVIDELLAASSKGGSDKSGNRENANRQLEEMFPELLASLDPEQKPVPPKAKSRKKLPEGFKFPACSPQDLAVSNDIIIDRMDELSRGKTLKYLRYNIQCVDECPLHLAFLIVGLPLATMTALVTGYGDPKYTKLFTENAIHISFKKETPKHSNVSQEDLDTLKSLYEERKEEIGDTPKWVSKPESHYLMDSWFMKKPRKGCNVTVDTAFTTNLAENTGKSVALAAPHMNSSLGNAVTSVLHIAKEALCLVLKVSVKKYFEGATPKFYANHGLVRTGNHVIRQKLHGDDGSIFSSDLFIKILNGEDVTAQELIDAGYVIDLPLSEEGRPLQIAIPMCDKQKFVVDVVLTPYGSMLVRSMTVPHGGHGGGCGNAVFHALVLAKGKTQVTEGELDDFESHLPRNGQKVTKHTERHFNGWSLEYNTGDGEPLAPEDWMTHVSESLKERGRKYAKSLFGLYEEDEESLMGVPRWLLSPMMIKMKKKKDDS